MADIEKVVLPDNSEYNLRDSRYSALVSLIDEKGLNDDIRNALLNCFANVAWINSDGQTYYDALEAALFPPLVVTSISCVYTQSGTVYNTTPLNQLKSDLVVTATYESGTTREVTDYTLSGTLTVGTSTVTVSYGGQTTTFNVTVTQSAITYLYNWDFTQSLTDTVGGVTATLSAKSGLNPPTQSSSGIVFDGPTQGVRLLTNFNLSGKTIEYDVAESDFIGNTSYHIRWLLLSNGTTSGSYNMSPFIWRATSGSQGCSCYGYSSASGSTRGWGSVWGNLSGNSSDVINCADGKTVKIECQSDAHTVSIYLDNALIGTQTSCYFDSRAKYLMFGSSYSEDQSAGDQCYNLTLTGLRIYETQSA